MTAIKLTFWQQGIVTLLLGLAYPLGFSPFDLPVIGMVSVAGLVLACLNHNLSQRLWLCYWFGLGLYGAGASWVYVSIHTYGQAPVLLAALMTAAFVAFLALCFAAPFLLLWRIPAKLPGLFLIVFPSTWVLSEAFRGWFLTGFPWLYLGHGHTDTWLSGWAPVGGVLTISWLAAFTAASAALIILKAGSLKLRTTAWVAVLALWLAGYGLQHTQWTQPGKTLSVALVQPNLPLEQKWDYDALTHILNQYTEQTEPLWGNDLIVWPESAIPRLLDDVRPYLSSVDRIARQNGSTLITGIPTRQGNQTFNSVIALGQANGIYHKRHLVPFGEYVPLENWLRGLIRFFDLPMSAFTSGNEQQPLLSVKNHPITTAICYEIVYQDLVAKSARNAEIILTVSNDTWFGSSFGPHQHFQIARMRAIENRKPLIRATNDGISALINERGLVSNALPQFQRGSLTATVTARQGTTPFNHTRSWPILSISLALLIMSSYRKADKATVSRQT